MTNHRLLNMSTLLIFCVVGCLAFVVYQDHALRAHAQVGQKQLDTKKVEPEKEEVQAVPDQDITVVANISPANLADEIHKLNKQGIRVSSDDIQIVGDRFVILIFSQGVDEDEEGER